MTDIDSFRAALRAEPDQEFSPLDLDGVMAAGGRLRRRRRALTTASAAGVTALVLVAAVAGGRVLADRRPGPGQPFGAGPGPVPADSSRHASAPAGRPDPHPSEDRTPVGDVISTGIRTHCGDLVFWLWRSEEPRLPETTFAVTAGCRTARGELRALITTNETEGSDRAPGFHAIEGATTIDDNTVPTFGYYAGPVAKITATVNGQVQQARQSSWSADAEIVVFWFDAAGNPQNVLGLTARDAAGNALPAGNATIGAG